MLEKGQEERVGLAKDVDAMKKELDSLVNQLREKQMELS